MTINMDDSSFKNFIAEVVAVGIRQYEETLRSTEKTINQAQAKRYLEHLGFNGSLLAKMVKLNLVTPVKSGESRSSQVKFSTRQFYKAVDEIRLKNKFAMINATAND